MTIVDTARAALIVAARLADDGMIPVPQTSGSKGMQIYAAVQPSRSRDVWSYVKELGVSLRQAYPEFFVSTMSIAQRAGRIYVDYNQDLAARNTIAPYSLRGRAMPVVATPVTWEEVAGVRGPDDLRFSPEDVLNRVAEQEDLAAELLNESRPALPH
jgi:bifunctional non-homologous end joining protein LigD